MADDKWLQSRLETFAQLESQLDVSPICDVAGIVGASGIAASRLKGEVLWRLTIPLVRWRCCDQTPATQLDERPLTIHKLIEQSNIQAFRDIIQPDTIVEMRVRLTIDNVMDSPQARLEQVLSTDFQDDVLAACLAQLQQPVVVVDDHLGTLTLNRRHANFFGTIQWLANTAEIRLATTDITELSRLRSVMRQLVDEANHWAEKMTDLAVTELLPFKNNAWLEPDEAELTPAAFKDRLRLETISVCEDSEFSFWYNDGDLFWGHTVVVYGTLAEGPIHAEFMG